MGRAEKWSDNGKCATPALFHQVKIEKGHIQRGKPLVFGQIEQVIQIAPRDHEDGISPQDGVRPSLVRADQPFFPFFIGLEYFLRHHYEDTASESFTRERSILIFSKNQYNRKMLPIVGFVAFLLSKRVFLGSAM